MMKKNRFTADKGAKTEQLMVIFDRLSLENRYYILGCGFRPAGFMFSKENKIFQYFPHYDLTLMLLTGYYIITSLASNMMEKNRLVEDI